MHGTWMVHIAFFTVREALLKNIYFIRYVWHTITQQNYFLILSNSMLAKFTTIVHSPAWSIFKSAFNCLGFVY